MTSLELKIPPPLVAAILALLMWLGARGLTGAAVVPGGRGLTVIAIAIAVLGLGVAMAGARQFRRAGTTVDPRRPAEAASLVTSGIYRLTRNPMYVGVTLVLLAWALYLRRPVLLVGPIAFVAYITRFQIRPEERILLDKFGDEYRQYLARVRRWI